jgi:hypothetical protein
MPHSNRISLFATLFAGAVSLLAVGGCGLFTPEKNPLIPDTIDPATGTSSGGMYEYNIMKHIQCEIRDGVLKATRLPNSEWIKHAGGLVTVKLTAEDQSALSPSAAFLTPLANMQSFTLGIAGSGSANATRTEQMAFAYNNGQLYKEALIAVKNGHTDCHHLQNGVFINSDLKIGQFIYDKVLISGAGDVTPLSQLQFEISFVAAFGGSITPTWTLTNTTVNGAGTLFGATRTDTSDVLITLGPLNADTKALHNAAITASGTGQAIRANTR